MGTALGGWQKQCRQQAIGKAVVVPWRPQKGEVERPFGRQNSRRREFSKHFWNTDAADFFALVFAVEPVIWNSGVGEMGCTLCRNGYSHADFCFAFVFLNSTHSPLLPPECGPILSSWAPFHFDALSSVDRRCCRSDALTTRLHRLERRW